MRRLARRAWAAVLNGVADWLLDDPRHRREARQANDRWAEHGNPPNPQRRRASDRFADWLGDGHDRRASRSHL